MVLEPLKWFWSPWNSSGAPGMVLELLEWFWILWEWFWSPGSGSGAPGMVLDPWEWFWKPWNGGSSTSSRGSSSGCCIKGMEKVDVTPNPGLEGVQTQVAASGKAVGAAQSHGEGGCDPKSSSGAVL